MPLIKLQHRFTAYYCTCYGLPEGRQSNQIHRITIEFFSPLKEYDLLHELKPRLHSYFFALFNLVVQFPMYLTIINLVSYMKSLSPPQMFTATITVRWWGSRKDCGPCERALLPMCPAAALSHPAVQLATVQLCNLPRSFSRPAETWF